MSTIPPILTGTYRHNKTGKLYEVVGVAVQTETDEGLVVYRPLYDGEHDLFARPYEMFTGSIELDGEIVPRFEKVPNKTPPEGVE